MLKSGPFEFTTVIINIQASTCQLILSKKDILLGDGSEMAS